MLYRQNKPIVQIYFHPNPLKKLFLEIDGVDLTARWFDNIKMNTNAFYALYRIKEYYGRETF